MTVARQPSATDSVAFEIDARTVRGETIRVIRGFAYRSDRSKDTPQRRPRPTSFYAVVRIMRDLELTLAAISGSLADGVDHATGGKRSPP